MQVDMLQCLTKFLYLIRSQTVFRKTKLVLLNKINLCSHTVDGYYQLDARDYMSQLGRPLPLQPHGTWDGTVADSDLAKQFSFWARWGDSSGILFDAKAFLTEHIQWSHLEGYLKDTLSQPWNLFRANEVK